MDSTARKRSDLGRMARGSTINMAGAGISGALGFVLSVVLARGLGVDDAGIFFEVIALYNILEVVGQAGAPSGLVRMIARDRAVGQEADVRPTIWVATIPVLVVSTAMGLFCVAAAPWITDVVMQGGDSAVGVEYLRTLAPFMIASTLAGTLARAFQGFGQMMPVVALTQVLRAGAAHRALRRRADRGSRAGRAGPRVGAAVAGVAGRRDPLAGRRAAPRRGTP